MTARKGKAPARKPAVKKVSQKPTTSSSNPSLKAYYHPEKPGEDFGFARFYPSSEQDLRGAIREHVLKKRRPAAVESLVDTAARVEVLLPPDAPEEYADIDRLISRYEEALGTTALTAFAQVTLRFPDVPNLHSKYEESREWARSHYALERGLPSILILHAPYLSGSDAAGHVHVIVLPTRLSRFGWVGLDQAVATDAGRDAAYRSWRAALDRRRSEGAPSSGA